MARTSITAADLVTKALGDVEVGDVIVFGREPRRSYESFDLVDIDTVVGFVDHDGAQAPSFGRSYIDPAYSPEVWVLPEALVGQARRDLAAV